MDRAGPQSPVGVGSGYGADASLSDPRTCGEDLVANLDYLAGFAEEHCVRCGGYHAWHGIDRVIRTRTGIDSDRPDLIAALRQLVASVGESRKAGPIELLIPGSADTAILATCAHAAWSLGAETASRLRYTVMDICETPLSLCGVYARRYGLALRTVRTDFLDPLPSLTADIVVLHSILRFISPARHVGFLQELGGMLAPSGRMLLSNQVQFAHDTRRDPKDFGILLKTAMDEGRLKPSVPVDRIMSRTKGLDTVMHEFADEEEMRTLIARSGLGIESAATIARLRERPAEAKPQYFLRFIAIVHS